MGKINDTKVLAIIFTVLALLSGMILVLYAKAFVALYFIKRLIMLGVLM